MWLFDLDDELGGDAEVLDGAERDRVARLATPTLRRRATARLVRRRQVLAGLLGVAADELGLTADERGRPRVARPVTDLDVSFSGSGHVGAVAVARGTRVGVDVEARRTLRDAERLARRVATSEELAVLARLGADELSGALLDLWARKEAYVKGTGEGLTTRLDAMELGTADAAEGRTVEPRNDGARWCVIDLTNDLELAASLVVASRGERWVGETLGGARPQGAAWLHWRGVGGQLPAP